MRVCVLRVACCVFLALAGFLQEEDAVETVRFASKPVQRRSCLDVSSQSNSEKFASGAWSNLNRTVCVCVCVCVSSSRGVHVVNVRWRPLPWLVSVDLGSL